MASMMLNEALRNLNSNIVNSHTATSKALADINNKLDKLLEKNDMSFTDKTKEELTRIEKSIHFDWRTFNDRLYHLNGNIEEIHIVPNEKILGSKFTMKHNIYNKIYHRIIPNEICPVCKLSIDLRKCQCDRSIPDEEVHYIYTDEEPYFIYGKTRWDIHKCLPKGE